MLSGDRGSSKLWWSPLIDPMEPPIGDMGDMATREDSGLALFNVSTRYSDSANLALKR